MTNEEKLKIINYFCGGGEASPSGIAGFINPYIHNWQHNDLAEAIMAIQFILNHLGKTEGSPEYQEAWDNLLPYSRYAIERLTNSGNHSE